MTANDDSSLRIHDQRSASEVGYRDTTTGLEIVRPAWRKEHTDYAAKIAAGIGPSLGLTLALGVSTGLVASFLIGLMADEATFIGAGVALGITLIVALLLAVAVPRRFRKYERTDREVTVRLHRDSLKTTPRPDESWNGEASLSDLRRIVVQEGEGLGLLSLHYVRAMLRDGRWVTLLDGIQSKADADKVRGRLVAAQEALRRTANGATAREAA